MLKSNNSQDYTSDKKLYQQKLKIQLDEWKTEVDRLIEKASDAYAEDKLELADSIEKLINKIEKGEKKVEEIEQSDDSLWELIREGIEAYWELLKINIEEYLYKHNYKGTIKMNKNGAKSSEEKMTPERLEKEIHERAHQIFLERDEKGGDALSDWLQAEKEIKKKYNIT